MEEKIQERINQIKSLASSDVAKTAGTNGFLKTEDSLSKLIRNSEEADMFLAELRTAVQVVKSQQK